MPKKQPTPSKPSILEKRFLALWQYRAEDWPAPVREHRFVTEEDTLGRTRFVTETGRIRMWRLDYAWPDFRLAVEIEGGVHSYPVRCNHCGRQVMTRAKPGKTKSGKPFKAQPVMATFGGHTRGMAYVENCRKYNAAHLLGWIVLRYTINDLRERPAEVVAEIQSTIARRVTPPHYPRRSA